MNELPAQQEHTFTVPGDIKDEQGVSGTLPVNAPDGSGDDDDLLSTSEAASLAGVDSRTIRRWFSSGKIKGKLDGHKLLVYSADVLKMSGTMPGTVEDFNPSDPGQEADMSGAEVVDIEVSPPKEKQASPDVNPERERLIAIIESQAHQLKAAGDVIVYLRSQLDDKEQEIKLLTCSESTSGWWAKFYRWFVGNRRE